MFDQLAIDLHKVAIEKGFWPEDIDDIFVAKQLMMIVSEVVEVMEAVRKDKGSEEIAKELLQDLFMKLWENREKVDTSKSFRSYLYTITVNLVYDFFRKSNRKKEVEMHFYAMSVDYNILSEDAIDSNENIQLVNDAINLLSPKRKKIFIMCKVDGMSYEEVSNELNVSKSTIHDHIVKANHFIKDYLKSNINIIVYLMTSFFLG